MFTTRSATLRWALTDTGKAVGVDVLGHRGWPALAHPENTCAAVEAALGAGSAGVEIDVRLTLDGEAVCLHDADLSRVAGRRDRIRAMPYDQLAAIRLPGGHAVARLGEIATKVAGRGQLVVDVKPDPRTDLVANQIVSALGRNCAEHDVVVSSTAAGMLQAVRRRAPLLRLALIAVHGDHGWSPLATALAGGMDGIHVDVRTFLNNPRLVANARDHGLVVRCWTVNRPAHAELAAIAGIDAIITDHPVRMLATLGRTRPYGPVSAGGLA
jgi:glycerophosphoryl diester phosphodiesterase